ncbi:molybdenum cofactor biosynthesis protein B [Halovenus sp. WSH3]|uniref:Molybdenum cofactor biosynthesis protein B n=1 Tax=Halovenus carboxidivorans TaxID=2692199 RepID=A0A6B0T858_9EURY|nr:MogA/MoaB family molybdenum cofactor biosynthesis protein [Halovenus carboxidivorans]MXR51381.1 molybdenum cofactor biosynthesis protein B [Halovenus carboxidivorans]
MSDHDHGESHDHGGSEGDGHEHSHGHDSGDDEGHQHSHLELDTVSFAVVTVSSSRTLENDPGGDRLEELIEAGGHEVAVRELVGDEREAIAATVEALVERSDVEAVVLTGGTGLSPEDVTVEAVRPLFDQEIPGFGELFRMLSYEDIGPRALLSRAFAGSKDGVAVFCLPGSEQGAAFGTEELVLPTVAHVLGHTQGE